MGQPVQGMPAAGMHAPQMSGLSAMGFMQTEVNGGSGSGMSMSQLPPVSFPHIELYGRPVPLCQVKYWRYLYDNLARKLPTDMHSSIRTI